MKIGNNTESAYGAALLGFEVGACGITDNYVVPPHSMRPVPLKGRYSTRKIQLSFEFNGASENTVVQNISALTAVFLAGTEMSLADGFMYYCVLDAQGTPKRVTEAIYTVMYDLVGVRHGSNTTHTLTQSGTVNIKGNCEAPAVFTVSGASGSYRVNGITLSGVSGTVVIDGINKTVKQNGANFFTNCALTKFPFVTPGEMAITISGTGTLKIEYQPIYL